MALSIRGIFKVFILLVQKRKSPELRVRQYQLRGTAWPAGSAVPPSPSSLLSLINSVQAWQHQGAGGGGRDNQQRILIQCMSVQAYCSRAEILQGTALFWLGSFFGRF